MRACTDNRKVHSRHILLEAISLLIMEYSGNADRHAVAVPRFRFIGHPFYQEFIIFLLWLKEFFIIQFNIKQKIQNFACDMLVYVHFRSFTFFNRKDAVMNYRIYNCTFSYCPRKIHF